MWKDPIVEEVRKIRRQHAKRFAFDLKAIVDDVQNQQRTSGRKYVQFAPRTPRPRRKAS